ncbi:unnamed protein product [Sympodiomycopsis kandeliae]
MTTPSASATSDESPTHRPDPAQAERLRHNSHPQNPGEASPAFVLRGATPSHSSSKRSSVLVSPSLSLVSDLSFDEEGIPHFASSPREAQTSGCHSRSESYDFPRSVDGEMALTSGTPLDLACIGSEDTSAIEKEGQETGDNLASTKHLVDSRQDGAIGHGRRSSSISGRIQHRPPFLTTASRSSSVSSVSSVPGQQAPTDPKARAILESAMRRAEEESENISVNLLRRLSAAQQKLNERGFPTSGQSSSDEDECSNEPCTAPTRLADVTDSVNSGGESLAALTTEAQQAIHTPIAERRKIFDGAFGRQHASGHERGPLTPRVKQGSLQVFPPPTEQTGDIIEPNRPRPAAISPRALLSRDPTLAMAHPNPRRWSMATTSLDASHSDHWTHGAVPDSISKMCGSPNFLSTPSPLSCAHRPATPVPYAVLQPSKGPPLPTPLTPLEPLEEERRRSLEDNKAWKTWGLEVWRLAQDLKRRVKELEDLLANQVSSEAADEISTESILSAPMGEITIPPPPSMAHDTASREGVGESIVSSGHKRAAE